MFLALIRYISVCFDITSKVHQRVIQQADKKMIITLVTSTVVPSVIWVSLQYFCDPATGMIHNFEVSNDTKKIIAFQDIPEEEREKSGAMVAMSLGVAVQLIITFALYARILYKTCVSSANLANIIRMPKIEGKKVQGKLT